MSSKLYLPGRYRARELIKVATMSSASPEALLAREDLGKFGEFVAGKIPQPHHQEWIDVLVTGEDSDALKQIAGGNLDILAPRGSAKSTWIALFVAWVIGHNPGIRIIYVSYSESVALSRSRLIKRIIESPKYREVFPWILPGKRWSDTDWEIRKSFAGVTDLDADFTLYAVGITGSINSRRSDLVVGDDLIKSSAAIESLEVREKIVTNWSEVIEPTLVPGGRIVDIGALFSAVDIHCTDFTEANGWRRIIQSAIVTDPETGEERSYWEERFKLKNLQTIRHKKPIIFSFQYQNRITRVSEISIDPNWINHGEIPEHFDSLVIGGDLSASEREKSDWTVFVLAGRSGNKFYILDLRRGRWAGNIDKLDQIIELWEDWDCLPMSLAAEAVAYQASLKGDFTQYLVNKKGVTNIIYQQPLVKGDKLQRLRGVSGLFQHGLVIFNQYRVMSRLIDELVNFGSIDHDDCVDAIVYALQALAGRRKLEVG